MPDFLKKAERQLTKVCAPDEQPLAAVFVRPRVAGETKRLGAPSGALGHASTALAETEAITENAVLVVTTQRILAFGHGSLVGRVKGLVGEFPLDKVASLSLDVPDKDAKGVATLSMTLTSGDVTVVTPGSRRKQFVEAYDKVAHVPLPD